MIIPLNANEQVEKEKRLVCPSCKAKVLQRVPRGRLVKTLLFWLPIKRYRCAKCHKKFYVWGK